YMLTATWPSITRPPPGGGGVTASPWSTNSSWYSVFTNSSASRPASELNADAVMSSLRTSPSACHRCGKYEWLSALSSDPAYDVSLYPTTRIVGPSSSNSSHVPGNSEIPSSLKMLRL